jgi:hypothetical protein
MYDQIKKTKYVNERGTMETVILLLRHLVSVANRDSSIFILLKLFLNARINSAMNQTN